MPQRVLLVVDDEAQIRRAVRTALASQDVRVVEAGTAAEALALAAAERPDVIVLDLGLPDRSGLDVCKDIRGWSEAPILILSARHSDDEKVALLDAGADDYLTKPFSTVELQARVRALLRRRSRPVGDTQVRTGNLVIDQVARSALLRGQEVHLTPIEWDLLRVLAAHAGRTLTHRQLFTEVWSGRVAGDAQKYLRVHVAHLRRKVEDDPVKPRYIITEPGVGYRFVIVPPTS